MEEQSFDLFLISQLIAKSILGELSVVEAQQLEDWLNKDERNREIYERYKNAEELERDLDFFVDVDMDAAWKDMENKRIGMAETIPVKTSKLIFLLKYYKMAAVAALVFIVGGVAFLNVRSPIDSGIVKDITGVYDNDVLPGQFKALLTLSNGEEIRFTEPEGLFSKVNLTKKERVTAEQVYHKLTVPKGGTFNFTLADGSKVFMNSESEIQFPEHFLEDRREVKLKGEAYFEVAKNKLKPFVIEVDGTSIEVLGTEFNIRSTDNGVETALVEGSVKLSDGNGAALILKPGELGNVNPGHITKAKADLRKMIAWKNNEFYFKDDRFVDVLNQLASWYDLEVVMEKEMESMLISGSIDRDVKLSETLAMLKYVTKGSFKVEGRKLTVMR